MTLQQAREKVLALIGDNATTPVFFDAEDVNEAIRSALSLIADMTGCLESTAVIQAVAGTAVYSLPADFQDMMACYYDGTRLLPEQMDAIRSYDTEWRTRTGVPYLYTLEHADQGGDEIRFYPAPSSGTQLVAGDSPYGVIISDGDSPYGIVIDTSVDSGIESPYGAAVSQVQSQEFTVYYRAKMPEISGDSDLLPLPYWAVQAVVWLATGYMLSGEHDLANETGARNYRAMAEYTIDRLLSRSNYKTPVDVVLGDIFSSNRERTVRDRWPTLIEVT